MRRAHTLVLSALAVALASCGETPDVPPPTPTTRRDATTPEPVSRNAPTAAFTPSPTGRPTATPLPSATPLSSPYFFLDVNADLLKDVIASQQGFVCQDGEGADQRIWTCSHGDEVAVSVYGASPSNVFAMRVVTSAGDPGDWMPGYASLVSVRVHAWVDDMMEGGVRTNRTDKIGVVWVETAHTSESDDLLMSTLPDRP